MTVSVWRPRVMVAVTACPGSAAARASGQCRGVRRRGSTERGEDVAGSQSRPIWGPAGSDRDDAESGTADDAGDPRPPCPLRQFHLLVVSFMLSYGCPQAG